MMRNDTKLEALATMGHADVLASNLIDQAVGVGMCAEDLVVVLAIAQKLLQTVLFPNQRVRVLELLQEADATFTAVSTPLEGH